MTKKQSAKQIAQSAFSGMLHINEVWVDEKNQKYYLCDLKQGHKLFEREDEVNEPVVADKARIEYAAKGVIGQLEAKDLKDLETVVEAVKEYFDNNNELADEAIITGVATALLDKK